MKDVLFRGDLLFNNDLHDFIFAYVFFPGHAFFKPITQTHVEFVLNV